MRVIKVMEEKYLLPALELVETVFTESEDAQSGRLVRSLVEEIRSKRFYLRPLELVMVLCEALHKTIKAVVIPSDRRESRDLRTEYLLSSYGNA